MILAFAYREPTGKYHHPDSVERRTDSPVTITSAWSGDEVTTDWYVKGTDTAVEQKLGKMGKSLNNSVDPLDIVRDYLPRHARPPNDHRFPSTLPILFWLIG